MDSRRWDAKPTIQTMIAWPTSPTRSGHGRCVRGRAKPTAEAFFACIALFGTWALIGTATAVISDDEPALGTMLMEDPGVSINSDVGEREVTVVIVSSGTAANVIKAEIEAASRVLVPVFAGPDVVIDSHGTDTVTNTLSIIGSSEHHSCVAAERMEPAAIVASLTRPLTWLLKIMPSRVETTTPTMELTNPMFPGPRIPDSVAASCDRGAFVGSATSDR